ncbi:MAG: DUF521 domain-containing protein, partial [Clostridia bacterium]|nr:DUF521 domain-containing protein [Clostridia bacterium]
MNRPEAYAMVEILGAAHAVQVIDQMVKCATLDVCGWETSCGGHATVVLSGAVSACSAAVDSIRENPPCEVCGMYLNEEQQAILNGSKGETMAKVMKTLVMYGETFGAERLVPVTSKY